MFPSEANPDHSGSHSRQSSSFSGATATEKERQLTTKQPTPKVQIERDRQGVTVEGYRTLGLVSTFIAGVESQCLGLLSDESDRSELGEVASALLLIGLSLSVLGAALSLLAARWFDLLKGDQIIMLEYRWACAQNNRKRSDPEAPAVDIPKELQGVIDDFKRNRSWRDYLVAKAVGSAVLIVFW
ncbi:unnamed protein product [Rhizoctonia solani]|uniref:Uncharacterized protein n=1 Tax=Rhizoctonia solani TaxID=456999 RepID=A0A8H3BB31_9AGAM|nr:unnamed protein product [Rhizoctonia solani]